MTKTKATITQMMMMMVACVTRVYEVDFLVDALMVVVHNSLLVVDVSLVVRNISSMIVDVSITAIWMFQ